MVFLKAFLGSSVVCLLCVNDRDGMQLSCQWVLDMHKIVSAYQYLSYSGKDQPVSPCGTVNSSHSRLNLKNILVL